jgi:hypothetical protein
MSKSRAVRLLAMLTAGGVVFQAGGCAVTFAPVVLSLAESVLLSVLTGGFMGP